MSNEQKKIAGSLTARLRYNKTQFSLVFEAQSKDFDAAQKETSENYTCA
jgi:hypothetical protein